MTDFVIVLDKMRLKNYVMYFVDKGDLFALQLEPVKLHLQVGLRAEKL